MKKRTILFDLDGVLVDSWGLIKASFEHILGLYKKTGVDLNDPRMRHGSLKQIYGYIGLTPEHDFEEIKKKHVAYQNENLNMIRGSSNSLATLQQLSPEFNIGVVTNRHGNSTQILKHVGIFYQIGLVVEAGDVPNPKPHPAGIFSAMKYFMSSPEDTIMIGDMPSDIEAGKSAGVFTIGMCSDNFPDTEKARPDFMIEDLGEIPQVIDKIWKK